MEAKQRKSFYEHEIAKSNLKYGFILTIFISIYCFAFTIMNMFVDGEKLGIPTLQYKLGYLIIGCVSLLFVLIFSLLKKNIEKNRRAVLFFSTVFVFFMTLVAAVITLADYYYDSSFARFNTIVDIIMLLSIPMGFYIKPLYYDIIQLSLLTAVFSLAMIYPSIQFTVKMIVGMSFSIFSCLVVFFARYKSKTRAVEQLIINNDIINEEKELNRQINKLVEELRIISIKDNLTGLYNRTHLTTESEKIWNECLNQEKKLAVSIVDIDAFKNVNDTYGHAVGDVVLKQVSLLIRENSISNGGVAFRFGGEEFLIYYISRDVNAVTGYMNDLREAINETYFSEAPSLKIDISFGVMSKVPTPKASFSDFLIEADKLLYTHKRTKGKTHKFGGHED